MMAIFDSRIEGLNLLPEQLPEKGEASDVSSL